MRRCNDQGLAEQFGDFMILIVQHPDIDWTGWANANQHVAMHGLPVPATPYWPSMSIP